MAIGANKLMSAECSKVSLGNSLRKTNFVGPGKHATQITQNDSGLMPIAQIWSMIFQAKRSSPAFYCHTQCPCTNLVYSTNKAQLGFDGGLKFALLVPFYNAATLLFQYILYTNFFNSEAFGPHPNKARTSSS